MNRKISFGTGGFRGVIGDDFNKQNIQLIAQGLANIIKEEKNDDCPIVIGFDNRFMSDYSAKWFAEVINGNGIKTLVYTHSVPTPTVMSTTRDMGNHYGIMVTASHNPYFFNGIKVFTKDGYDADVTFTSLLEKRISEIKEIKTLNEREAKKQGLYEDYDNLGSYLSHIKSFIDPSITQNKLKVLYNNMNGVGVIGLKPLAEKLHIYQFVIMNEDHDAFFGFNLPNPTKEALMGEFSETVYNQGYDLGMATDSDGDRLGIIDEKGNYVSANEILAVIYWYLVKHRGYKGDVIKNCATSILVDMVAKSLGYKCHEVDVGFKNITAGMRKYDALLGGESSGGLTMRGYIYGKDATFSGALFLEMVIKLHKPVSEIISDLKKSVGYDYYCSEDSILLDVDAQKVLTYMREKLPNLSLKYQDIQIFNRNMKFLFEDNQWLLLRLSGTEPSFRIFTEFKNKSDAETLVKEVKEYIGKAQELIMQGVKVREDSKYIDTINQFEISGVVKDVLPLGNGHINSTFLVSTSRGKKYVLQKINTYAFKNVDQLMHNFYNVTYFLTHKGYRSLSLIKTNRGELYYRTNDDECYRMYVYIDNAIVYEGVDDLAQIEKAAKAFGMLHKSLADYNPSSLYEVIPHFHDTYQRYLNLLDAIKEDKLDRVKDCIPEIEKIKGWAKEYPVLVDGIKDKKIHLSVTHNDPKINNVLFEKKTGDFYAVVDLDTVMPGSYLYDYGDALRYLFSGENEDSKDLSKLVCKPDVFEAYTKGYLSEMKDVLNDYEKSLLPFSAFLLTIECGIRFLEDYIRGDVYFRTKYPEHNLVRARTQIKLAGEIYSDFNELKTIVDKLDK